MDIKATPSARMLHEAGDSSHHDHIANTIKAGLPSSAINRIEVRTEVQNLATDSGLSQRDILALRASGRSGEDASASKAVVSAEKSALLLAQKMIDSYNYEAPGVFTFLNKGAGVSSFTIPAGVADVEAMRALNVYFRDRFHRDAILELSWFETLPKTHPKECQERDCSQAREVNIVGVVNGTKGKSPSEMEKVLAKKSLVFADPRDLAIVHAIHACKHNGEDLFRGLEVVHSLGSRNLKADYYNGIAPEIFWLGYDRTVASGTPAPKLK